jgi:hypothetical protein
VLTHAADQAERIGGIGDLLEDDLEQLHQIYKKITDRTGRIKNNAQHEAKSHSQMEAKLINREIIARTAEFKAKSKREFKRQRIDAFARGAQAKMERDMSKVETLASVKINPYARIGSYYESEKANLLNSSADG